MRFVNERSFGAFERLEADDGSQPILSCPTDEDPTCATSVSQQRQRNCPEVEEMGVIRRRETR